MSLKKFISTCRVPLTLTWKNISKKIDIFWFQHESDPSRNSNVYEVAQKVVNDNFPGEFGSERLVQQVVDSILASTELRENLQQVKGQHPAKAPPPQGMEGMATYGGGGGSSGSSPNKAQESEGMKLSCCLCALYHTVCVSTHSWVSAHVPNFKGSMCIAVSMQFT